MRKMGVFFKRKYTVFVWVITVLFLVRCKKRFIEPTPAKPTTDIVAKVVNKDLVNGGNAFKGDTIIFTINTKTPAGFESLEVFNLAKSLEKFDKAALKLVDGAKEAKNVKYEYKVIDEKVNVLKFVTTDVQKQTKEVEFKMKIFIRPTLEVLAKLRGEKFIGGEVTKGDSIVFTANVKTPSGFESLQVFNGSKSLKKFDKATLKLGNDTKAVKNIKYSYKVTDKEGSSVLMKFVLTDVQKQTKEVEFKMKVAKRSDG